MPSKIQQLLEGRDNNIDYDKLIKKYPWIIKKDVNCILSHDSDGLLCGLLMSNLLNWKIVGFYDGKVMVLKKGMSAKDCVFLDMEIFRKDIKSFGHHMLLFNRNSKPSNWDNFDNCIQPNNLREYDKLHDFRLKYPLGTIHMLLGILGHKFKIELKDDAIPALFFTDGTFNVLFGYPENVLNWLSFLRYREDNNPLKTIFLSDKNSVHNTMVEMDKFFRERDKINVARERGDRLKISNKDGTPYNIELEGEDYNLNKGAVDRIKRFVNILSNFTGWKFKEENWMWSGFRLYKFTKAQFTSQKGDGFNNSVYSKILSKNPLSWAITAGNTIEYTLEEPDKLD